MQRQGKVILLMSCKYEKLKITITCRAVSTSPVVEKKAYTVENIDTSLVNKLEQPQQNILELQVGATKF